LALIEHLLGTQLWAWLMIFARVGTAFIVMPLTGDTFVNTNMRLLLAATISFLVVPTLAPELPPQPANVFGVLVLVFGESVIGLFIGTAPRMLMSALDSAGMVVAAQTGLANATMFNPAMASQGTLPAALMGWLGLLLLFVTDLHHLLLSSVVDSYQTFRPGAVPPFQDMAVTIARVVADSFSIGIRLAAPFIATGLIFALALGVLGRLAPQIQVYFLFMSAQVAIGLILLSLTLSAIMLFWLNFFEQSLIGLMRTT
jgi:flagellar biosynthesis protein FliR